MFDQYTRQGKVEQCQFRTAQQVMREQQQQIKSLWEETKPQAQPVRKPMIVRK